MINTLKGVKVYVCECCESPVSEDGEFLSKSEVESINVPQWMWDQAIKLEDTTCCPLEYESYSDWYAESSDEYEYTSKEGDLSKDTKR